MAEIHKLQTEEERKESHHLAATSFLHTWDEKKDAEESADCREDTWGIFNDAGKMMACIITQARKLTFEGQSIPAGEAVEVVSLPEFHGQGNVNRLMRTVLDEFKKRGDVFAILIPFSFAFYRKYGFELISRNLEQDVPIEQLAEFRCDYSVRQAESPEEIPVMRKLYEEFAMQRNMVQLKEEKDWAYHGNGEYGDQDWFNEDKQQYTYIFSDASGTSRAWLRFFFQPGPEGPFIGTMNVTELVYDSPEAFRNVLGFIYGMRAKLTNVKLTLMDRLDLSLLLPECDKVERKLEGHYMARVLDVEKVLRLRRYPADEGQFTIHIKDNFMPENTGSWRVAFSDSKTVSVVKTEEPADLELSEQTFCQLAVGLTDLYEASYRDGTRINGNRETLERVFCKRTVCP